jgi:hypothetical protein
MKMKRKTKIKLMIIVSVFILLAGIWFAYTKSIDSLYAKVQKEYAAQYATTISEDNQNVKDKEVSPNKQEEIKDAGNKSEKSLPDSALVASPSPTTKETSNSSIDINESKDSTTKKIPDKEIKQTGPPKVTISVPVPIKTLDSKAEAITDMEIETDDYFVAGAIILKKLGPREINYLFGAAKDNLFLNSSVEQLEKIRADLFSKLSGGDIATLRIIGNKYGKAMYMLNPDLNIKEHKAYVEKLKAKADAKAAQETKTN